MRILIIGNPNVGKSTLFGALTDTCPKTANHAGVTVTATMAKCCQDFEWVDLPGLYSLKAYSDEEQVSIDALNRPHDGLLFVLDATQIRRNLFLLTQLQEQGHHPVIALTQTDLALRQGLQIDTTLLATRLGLKIVSVLARTGQGLEEIRSELCHLPLRGEGMHSRDNLSPEQRYAQIDALLKDVISHSPSQRFDIDQLLLHPVVGLICLTAIFSTLFLSLFGLGKPTANLLESGFDQIGLHILSRLPNYPLVASLLVDGILAGVGTLLAFLPLIGLLGFLLGILEESGYLARATFLLDRLMSKAGLSGRAFVPMLSGFTCAIPAILSTRVIKTPQNRLVAMMVIPFLSCSARLPLYALLIAAFFPAWQGAFILLGIYMLGVLAALLFGFIFKRFWLKASCDELILELPPYRLPTLKHLLKSVSMQLTVFLKQAGTLILSMSILMWALFHFPQGMPLEQSYAGQFGRWIEPLMAPLGFDWKISVGLIASFSARELMVSTLGILHGFNAQWNEIYSPLTATSLMVFFALAMQCLSTLAVMRRETKSWKWPLVQFTAMTGLAWICSFTVYQLGSLLGY